MRDSAPAIGIDAYSRREFMCRAAAFVPTIHLVLHSVDSDARPVLDSSDAAFFCDQARRIVESARLAPGQAEGQWRNATPYTLHVPGGNMGYPAFWVRDAVMMLGGDFIPPAELEGWIRLMSAALQGPKDWHVRPGVVVPAFSVPDHIEFDGKPTFYPGTYDTGSKQGGHPFGKYPPLDDNFYFLKAVYEYWAMTHSLVLFRSRVETSFGKMTLAELCERVYKAVSADRSTGLVTAGSVRYENAKDWGFCDAEFKSGKLLFPSLLKYVASTELAELFRASGEAAKAREYQQQALQLKRSIPRVFFRSTQSEGEGWLYSSTGVGHQPDVWGSAFAVWSGAVEGRVARRVSRALVAAFRERTAVRQGCVRQILTNDPSNHGGWQSSIVKLGTYQNGGYWGTPSGWYIAAMNTVDHRAAVQMAREYIRFLRGNRQPGGTSAAWEWFNPYTGQHNNPLYVATVALPYLSLKAAGLLDLSDQALAAGPGGSVYPPVASGKRGTIQPF
ncbi:MAG TPA: hypothetical protein VMW54_14470 [Terriglobia bacterium]|nr:hypothetical protein [Terriglobia bacterium]